MFLRCGLPPEAEVKIYRHVDHVHSFSGKQFSIQDIINNDNLDYFQACQSSHLLGNEFVAFFIGETGRLSRFLGMWKVENVDTATTTSSMAKKARTLGYLEANNVWYDLERDIRFSNLENRLIIEWPATGRHHQWLQRKDQAKNIPIHEIRAIGVNRAFTGYDDVLLTFSEMRSLIKHDATGWKEALSSTRGVYLITDVLAGDLYVGSATGRGGLWSRWADYSKSVHGGNKIMIDKVENISAYEDRLQISILETLGNLASRKDGLNAEQKWKKKLGKKAVILNAN